MDNVIEFKNKKERSFKGNIVDCKIGAIYQLMDDDEFFALINSDINYEITDPIITRMHGLEGWAIGLETLVDDPEDDSHVTLNCTKAGAVKMYKSLDEANITLWNQGLGNPKIYNFPINSKTFD